MTLFPSAVVQAQPNPYCVAGGNWNAGGVMEKLSMPGGPSDINGSLIYSWGQITEYNLVIMPAPCHTYTNPPMQCYNEDTDTIEDAAALAAWVPGHPGRVWLMGNEPNGGDNLTNAEYARFFKKYHDLVTPLDPTAQFAVAGLGGTADTDSLNTHIEWWDETLAEYQSQFGEPMPIDIWNCHPYTTVGRLDIDISLDEYIVPFRDYVDTVENGLYAGSELWLTEFGVATWITPLDPHYINEFMQQACPRLEASSAADRLFWFYGPWAGSWDMTFADVSLIGPDGQPTLIG